MSKYQIILIVLEPAVIAFNSTYYQIQRHQIYMMHHFQQFIRDMSNLDSTDHYVGLFSILDSLLGWQGQLLGWQLPPRATPWLRA